MSEWNNYFLGGLAEITSSKRIFYSEYVDSGIPFYRSKEVINLFKKEPVHTELFITHERFNEIESKFGVPKENDILLTSVGSLGIPYLVKASDKFYFKDGNLTWFRNIDKSLLDPKYLYIWLSSSIGKQKLDEVTIGSTQAALTISGLKTIEIELPPLPEQKAIASVLSSLDDKIDLLHRQNKTLEAMAETLFRQWFIEEAKEDWLTVQVKDIVKQIKPGTNYQPKRLESGIPFLNVRNLKNGQIDLQGISFISQEEYERVHKAWKPEVGDVLISRIGTLGIVAVLGKRDMPMAVHYNMLVLKPNLTNTAFLYFLLRSQYFQDLYSSKARQSVQEYVAVEDAEAIELKLPLNDADFVKKQEQFSDLFNKIRANLAQIQTLEKLRDTLLPKLMSGEVRVQYQTEEVA